MVTPATSIRDFIVGHQIPANKYNIRDIANKFAYNIYPLRNIEGFNTGLRQYGISIVAMSSTIATQLYQSELQIEYTNKSIEYTAIFMFASMLPMTVVGWSFSVIVALVDNILARIAAEAVFSIINGWLSSVIIDGIVQSKLHMDNKELRNQSWLGGALGAAFGLPIFMLHNGLLNGISRIITPISNTLAAVETSIATSGAMSEIYNQKFDIKEAAIAGVGMGAISAFHGAFSYGVEKFTDSYREHISDIITDKEINDIFNVDSGMYGQVHKIGRNIYLGDGSKNNKYYILAKDFPDIPQVRVIHTDHVAYLRNFIQMSSIENTALNETFLLHNCNSHTVVEDAIARNYGSFIVTRKAIEQMGRHIIGDFVLYRREGNGYRELDLGNDLIEGLKEVTGNGNMREIFNESYSKKWGYPSRRWGEDNLLNNTNNVVYDNVFYNNVGDLIRINNATSYDTLPENFHSNVKQIPINFNKFKEYDDVVGRLNKEHFPDLDNYYFNASVRKVNENELYLYTGEDGERKTLKPEQLEYINIVEKEQKQIVEPIYLPLQKEEKIINNTTDIKNINLHEDIVDYINVNIDKILNIDNIKGEINNILTIFKDIYPNIKQDKLFNLFEKYINIIDHLDNNVVKEYEESNTLVSKGKYIIHKARYTVSEFYDNYQDFDIVSYCKNYNVNLDIVIKMLDYYDLKFQYHKLLNNLFFVLKDEDYVFILDNLHDYQSFEIIFNNENLPPEHLTKLFNTLSNKHIHQMLNNKPHYYKYIFDILNKTDSGPYVFNKIRYNSFVRFVKTFEDNDYAQFINLFIRESHNNKLFIDSRLWNLNHLSTNRANNKKFIVTEENINKIHEFEFDDLLIYHIIFKLNKTDFSHFIGLVSESDHNIRYEVVKTISNMLSIEDRYKLVKDLPDEYINRYIEKYRGGFIPGFNISPVKYYSDHILSILQYIHKNDSSFASKIKCSNYIELAVSYYRRGLVTSNVTLNKIDKIVDMIFDHNDKWFLDNIKNSNNDSLSLRSLFGYLRHNPKEYIQLINRLDVESKVHILNNLDTDWETLDNVRKSIKPHIKNVDDLKYILLNINNFDKIIGMKTRFSTFYNLKIKDIFSKEDILSILDEQFRMFYTEDIKAKLQNIFNNKTIEQFDKKMGLNIN